MTAAPAYEVLRGRMVRVVEEDCRLNQLHARAVTLGMRGSIVIDDNGRPYLSLLVSRNGSRIGSITIDEAVDGEEQARLSVDCDALVGMHQADVLVANAAAVAAAFKALVGES